MASSSAAISAAISASDVSASCDVCAIVPRRRSDVEDLELLLPIVLLATVARLPEFDCAVDVDLGDGAGIVLW